MNKFLTVEELADYLHLPSKEWVYRRTTKNGPEIIPHRRFGKHIRFQIDSEDFKKWLAKH